MTTEIALDMELADVIALALTPELLRPASIPRRPLMLGSQDRFCLHPDYRSNTVHANADANAAASSAKPNRAALEVASRIGDAIGRDRVVACLDALQRVADPATLLRSLHDQAPNDSVFVLSVPMRPMPSDRDDPGPPANPAHANEWTVPELQAFLDGSGFEVLFGGEAGDTEGADVPTAIMVATRREQPAPVL